MSVLGVVGLKCLRKSGRLVLMVWVGGSGSYVEHEGQIIMHQLIPLDVEKRVVDWLHRRGLEFYLESNNGLFASEDFREVARPVLRAYAQGKEASAEEVGQLEAEEALHGLVYGAELYRADLNKISFILKSYQDHLDSKEAFPELKAGTWGAKESTLFLVIWESRILQRLTQLMYCSNI